MEKLAFGDKIAGFRSEEKVTLPQAETVLKKIASAQDALNSRQRRALEGLDAYLRKWAV
jgi:hypothetical protein